MSLCRCQQFAFWWCVGSGCLTAKASDIARRAGLSSRQRARGGLTRAAVHQRRRVPRRFPSSMSATRSQGALRPCHLSLMAMFQAEKWKEKTYKGQKILSIANLYLFIWERSPYPETYSDTSSATTVSVPFGSSRDARCQALRVRASAAGDGRQGSRCLKMKVNARSKTCVGMININPG